MIRALAIFLCLAEAVLAQQFAVASVKPSLDGLHSTSGIYTGHGKIDAKNVTLKGCIMSAYGVGPHQIAGGPDWLDSDRFAILAKADPPTNDDTVLMKMLESLLADRFKLTLHRETRTISVLILEIGKNGPKLEKAGEGEAVTNTSTSNSSIAIDARYTNMDAFAHILARRTDLPVLNHTGLTSNYHVKLQWTPENMREGLSLFTAIQEQLGLRLRSAKAPVDILVIDHAEKPSEN